MNRTQNQYGTPRISVNERLETAEVTQLKHQPITLNARQRLVVESAIREVCINRGYLLQAISVRTNHVHTVVSVARKPELVMRAFKAYATRALRKAGLLAGEATPWSRHGSTRYLWKERHVEKAIDYVLYGQGDELPRFDDDD